MNTYDIRLIFDYNQWANERILDTAENLTPEQLRAPNALGWGDLHGMLTHILDAEYGWRSYLAERKDRPWLKSDDFANLAAIRERWGQENAALSAYLGGLSAADLDGLVDYDSRGETRYHVLWHCLYHMVNHGTQHRSECAALLTNLGHSPGDMDFGVFLGGQLAQQATSGNGDETAMRHSDIQLIFQYNEWANRRILEAAEGISNDEWTTPNQLGWGDLRGILVHIVTAEIGWRNRLSGQGELERPAPADFADVAALRARYESEAALLRDYINGLSDAAVNDVVTFERGGRTFGSTLWHFLLHLANHGTQHRSECAALLTDLGRSPGDMDFTLFLRQRDQTA